MPPRRAAATEKTSSRRRPRVSYKESDDSDSDSPPVRRKAQQKQKRKRAASSSDEESDDFKVSNDESEETEGLAGVEDNDEDDDDHDEEDVKDTQSRKRSKTTQAKTGSAASNGRNGRVVKKLARAPARPPPDTQISETLMNFLRDLQDDQKNTREWFAENKTIYQYAWDNLNAFATALLPKLMEIDDTVPWLPARDCVYRIYRDIRFSKSQVPYKTNLCATFSRGGRKGPFAGYHIQVEPGNRSFAAGGRWCPMKEHLAAIRKHILDDTELGRRLKQVVTAPEFEAYFGKATPASAAKPTKGKKARKSDQDETKDTIVTTRQSQVGQRNIFGFEDELKIAPKIEGLANVKEHKDIAWLRLRSFLVKRDFSDEQVTQPDFMEEVVRTFAVMQPLIEVLNDMVYPPPTPPPSDDEGDPNEGLDDEELGLEEGEEIGLEDEGE